MAVQSMVKRTAIRNPHLLARRVYSLLEKRRCLPRATYRLEFHPQHRRFSDARKLIPYLAELEISHVYASPLLKSFSGAPHGYATVDYSQLNPALGSRQEFDRFVAELHAHQMGLILDIVPNHMSSASRENAWWNNVLEHGQSSPYADFFDIDWHPAEKSLRNRLLLPILGEDFGKVLECGQLELTYDQGRFSIDYYEHHLPVDPSTYRAILEPIRQQLHSEELPADQILELESILTALRHLPDRTSVVPELAQERQRETLIAQKRLQILFERSPELRTCLKTFLREFNGNPGNSQSFNCLELLLNEQVYRLSAWRSACDEINYRRFFDINELAAICTEKLPVFQQTHSLIFELLVRGELNGLRIDHVDGLYDPKQYLNRLQWGYVQAFGKHVWNREKGSCPWEEIEVDFLKEMHEKLGGPDPLPILFEHSCEQEFQTVSDGNASWKATPPLFVLVEKILGPEEPLPRSWPVAGTSGYDFLNLVNGLFVDPAGYARIRRSYQRFSGHRQSFAEEARESKRVILDVSMSSELHLLAHRLKRLAERNRHSRDLTLNSLIKALREIIVAFSVYRTYISPRTISSRDRTVIDRAIRSARRANPAMDAGVFHFIRRVLLWEFPDEFQDQQQLALFVGRFQQVTSPVTAKGVEDTAFYRDVPLLSVNEVGSHPPSATVSIAQFHAENLSRLENFPATMLCSSTHDTKRSEDVRARINALTEIPEAWRTALGRWSRWNRHFRTSVHDEPAPSRNDEYLFYQTLIGVWPAEAPSAEVHAELTQRLLQFMMKAIHEAKERTSWVSPDHEYEQAVERFVQGTLRQDPGNRFLQEIVELVQRIDRGSRLSSLSALVLKMTAPGVPDLYQGQELWDDSLVDPDNRRCVDDSLRRKFLKEIRTASTESPSAGDWSPLKAWISHPGDPCLKLFVLWRCLQLRKEFPRVFREGAYHPLRIQGPAADSVCAFARRLDGETKRCVIAVVPRACQTLAAATSPLLGWSASCETEQAERNDVCKTTILPGAEILMRSVLQLDDLRADTFRHQITGRLLTVSDGTIRLSELFSEFPLAVLASPS